MIAAVSLLEAVLAEIEPDPASKVCTDYMSTDSCGNWVGLNDPRACKHCAMGWLLVKADDADLLTLVKAIVDEAAARLSPGRCLEMVGFTSTYGPFGVVQLYRTSIEIAKEKQNQEIDNANSTS